jgi:hypothetical protein
LSAAQYGLWQRDMDSRVPDKGGEDPIRLGDG